jgi:hypothetical protein
MLIEQNEDNSSENARLKKEIEELKNISKKDTLQKAKKVKFQSNFCEKSYNSVIKEVKSYWDKLTSVVGNGIKKQAEKVCTFVENRK